MNNVKFDNISNIINIFLTLLTVRYKTFSFHYIKYFKQKKTPEKGNVFYDIWFLISKTHKNIDIFFTYLHFTLSCKQALVLPNMQRAGYITHAKEDKLL